MKLQYLDLLMATYNGQPFNAQSVVAKFIAENPKATQAEVYRHACADLEFVRAAVTKAVTDALLAIGDKDEAA